ncbi:MAG: S8 family serine peptidase [Pyrinomonadaceae bacterium]
MTKNASTKRKTNHGVNMLNPRAATVVALLSLFALAWFITSRSIRVSAGDNQQRTEFVEGRDVVAGDVLVKFRSGATEFSVFHAAQDADADENEQVSGSGIRRFHSRSKTVATLVRELSARGDVEYAEPNYIVHANVTPNDPRFPELWGLQNTGQTIGGVVGTPGADIEAPLAWDISTGNRNTVVGVIDTGIDYNHPDLAANVWSAPTAFSVTVGGVVINCAAGTHGFNAINNTCNPLDDNNHGSHVSGTIGGIGNNGVGVAGVNWTASMMGLKFLDSGGSGSTANAIKAIDFAIQTKNVFGASANEVFFQTVGVVEVFHKPCWTRSTEPTPAICCS